MREIARDHAFAYVKFDEAADVDRVQIRSVETDPEGFEFFRGLGIVGYARTFKAWLRHFPRPVFLAALRDREVVGWAFLEESSDPARDGSPVYILRAIETLPELRGKRIGHRLLLLAFGQVTGYVLTKPLTKEARRFFLRAGFSDLEAEERPPVDPRRFAGYVALPPHRRREALAQLGDYFPTPGAAGGESPGGRTPGPRG
jgi:GNAT superfamily N-acetyltransferase